MVIIELRDVQLFKNARQLASRAVLRRRKNGTSQTTCAFHSIIRGEDVMREMHVIAHKGVAALKLYTAFQNTNLEKHNTPIIRTHLEISLLDGSPLITAEIRNVISTDWLEHTL